MILELLTQGPILLAGLLAVAALAIGFARVPTVASWALIVAFVTTSAMVPPVDLQVTQGGITLYALDFVAGLMLVIGLARLVSRFEPSPASVTLVILSGLFVLSILRGLQEFGLQEAVNSSRPW